jgi:hypothetical protein
MVRKYESSSFGAGVNCVHCPVLTLQSNPNHDHDISQMLLLLFMMDELRLGWSEHSFEYFLYVGVKMLHLWLFKFMCGIPYPDEISTIEEDIPETLPAQSNFDPLHLRECSK